MDNRRKKTESSTIYRCFKCRKQRGKLQNQKMADLPIERLTPAPPFTYVGLDVFGPWQVTTRKTRGGAAQSKRWAVVFICLTIRAIHIELIETMDTSSFINALRRFFAVMSPVVWCHIYKKLKRCDLCLHKKYVIICQPKLSSLNRRISLSHYGQNLPFFGYCLSSLKSFRQLKQCE